MPSITISPTSATVNGIVGVAQPPFQFNATGLDVPGAPQFAVVGMTYGEWDFQGFRYFGDNQSYLTLNYNPALGSVGTPAGTYARTVQASINGETVSATVTFVIAGSGGGGTAVDDATATATVGQPFTFQATGSGDIGGWYIPNLPAGLTYNTTTGLISGVPTTAGLYAVTLTALQDQPGGSPQAAVATGTLTLTVQAVGAVDDSHIMIEVNLGSGLATVVNGVPQAFYGDQKVIKTRFVPTGNAGNVTNVRATLKEKGEVLQYGALLPTLVAPPGNGTTFTFPVTTFAGDALRDSLMLYDEDSPSTAVAYALEIFFDWAGRTRKSSILDFLILRPQDMDFATAAPVIPSNPPPAGPTSQLWYSPNGTAFKIGVDDSGIVSALPA